MMLLILTITVVVAALSVEPSSGSYEIAGRPMKIDHQLAVLEPALRRMVMPDYISNYFPLVDIPLGIDGANLISHEDLVVKGCV